MTRSVTVGVDGTPASLAAADWGAREARLRGVPLRLVHVWEWEWEPYPYTPPEGPEAARRWSEGVPREVTAPLRERYPGLGITADRLAGTPSEVLCAAAGESELLVVGTMGVGRLAGFLLGSVAMACVARSARPVVVVRARPSADGGLPGPEPAEATARPVVLGLELGRPCDDLIRFAFDAALPRGAPLLVVHGWNPPPYLVYGIGAALNWGTDISAGKTSAVGEALAPWRERYPAVDVREQAVVGEPAHHLLEASSGAGLLVIGRRTRPAPAARPRIGHIAQAVLHHCPAPVAVVPYG
ncbi:universal stress protein [Streptomyces gilvosporeus]|uniref:UspA domain-containing protein n=1 Tax=Streptomyces gilvosporeus TaxID=553510 RepID=A0A1V0TLT8_9ACTN|nr:universal stress protein [Streptomyces gilvosporeus]ARF53863.1 hypothetical protein B1H19_06435 [Streptomyces gilvosporeus]